MLAHLFYGLDLSEIETYRDRVVRVTPADIQRVAKQFLKPDQLSIVLVGDASVFADQLEGTGSRTSSAFRWRSSTSARRRSGAARPRRQGLPTAAGRSDHAVRLVERRTAVERPRPPACAS